MAGVQEKANKVKLQCPKISSPLQISWCKIVNTRQVFATKFEAVIETIILN